MSVLAGWRPALRMAWRDVRRSRGRTILVLVMIALPVLAVTAADVVYATSKVNSLESLDRRLGAADARLASVPNVHRVVQWTDPDSASAWSTGRHGGARSLADAERILGHPLPEIPLIQRGDVRVPTTGGAVGVDVTETDLASPLSQGLFRRTTGRWPTSVDEVVVNRVLAEDGYPLGSHVLVHGHRLTVVGVAESTTYRAAPVLAGLPGSIGVKPVDAAHTWLVGGGAVSWADVRALNAVGFAVLSRQVIEHPPSEAQLPPQVRYILDQGRGQVLAVLALVVAMALLEVVLLAGPAFAVGARRQARTLALMAAVGGTPRQARRVILASGFVLGGLAAVIGAVVGVVVAVLAVPRVQLMSDEWFGPFQVPWTHLLGIAAFGLLSAFLAAVVPAWIASRQDVVAVLAGRRGDRPPTFRSPLLGVLLLAGGIGGSMLGARQTGGNGAYLIAAAAIVSVVGMIFCVPLVLVGLSRASARLPLVGRYAVRDAARQRTRTVPAVAAVAATVAGVVALGVANASQAESGRATYTPMMTIGVGAVSYYGRHPDWASYAGTLRQYAPDARVEPIRGIGDGPGVASRGILIGGRRGLPQALDGYSSVVGSGVLVSSHAVPRLLTDIPAPRVRAAEDMLASGGAVVLVRAPIDSPTVRLTSGHRHAEVRALYVVAANPTPSAQAVVSPRVAADLGLAVRVAGLAVTGVSPAQEKKVQEAFSGVSRNLNLYVERGYVEDQATKIVMLILGILGAVLMLGGTLTATFLALSDARPDLATLSAVGASPRTRRGVAAAYALVVGFVGAVLGAAVGFIPGIAVTYPLTGSPYSPTADAPSHYLDVPWTLILVLVVALPLVTALLVGLTARSRLPLVARLD